MKSISYEPSQNPFETIIVDLTNRCNMNCNNCYIPNRNLPDIQSELILNAISKLPQRTNIRLAGAEPTLRKDLPEIIQNIRSLGHRVAIMTNGLRLANLSYVRALKKSGLRHVYISLNGVDDDSWYLEIDQLACARKKMSAFDNLVSERMLINTGTILVRGLNEGAVSKMIDLAYQSNLRHMVIKFRNIGAIGRYDQQAEDKNLSFDEMILIVANALGRPSSEIRSHNLIKGFEEENSILFPIVEGMAPGSGVWIKVTNWQADNSGAVDFGSDRRGQLLRNMRVACFFENIPEFD